MNRMIRKIMVLVLIMGTLVGCNNATADAPPQVITVWHYYNGAQKEAFDTLTRQFNETQGIKKNVIVEAVSKGTIPELVQALNESVEKKVGADPLPQICGAYADTAYEVNEKGLVVDIGDYMTKNELNEYVEPYLEEGRFGEEDTLKLFPIGKSTEVLTVNMTAWENFAKETEVSIDQLQTWEGIAKVAEIYYDWSGGKAFFGRDAFANYMLIGSHQLGQDVFSVVNGQWVLNYDKKVMRKLWEYYYVPFVSGYYAADGKFRSDDLKTGKIIALVGSTSGVAYTPSSVTFEDGTSYEIQCQIFPLPNFKGKSPAAVQQGAGMMILKSDPILEEHAVWFLKWMTEEKQNLEFCIKSGYLPVKIRANEEETIRKTFEETSIDTSTMIQQSFQVGSSMVREYELYTPKAFEWGNEARILLENDMVDQAKADRKLIEEMIEGGVDREDALKSFTDTDHFEQWYEDSNKKLQLLGE